MNQGYRPEIEGMRAIAIMPILLFHLDTALCPGGYVGVDIFFVISGYLITRMIVTQGKSFSLLTFYRRRFFRLFPALLATLAASLAAGWLVLGPYEYAQLARSAIMAVFGVSNFYFLGAVDYFSSSSLSHPLLHTWSLGVEEQFYLLWPALLIMAGRWAYPLWLIAAAAVSLSFSALVLVQPVHPESVFYMMPFRTFEFAIGAALVNAERNWGRVPKTINALAGVVALVLLAISFASFNEGTRWPGPWTLVPALATAVLILSSSQGGLLRTALSHRVPCFFGRISYSLYLVHWPLIALYRSHSIAEPNNAELAFLGLLTIALGVALFITVENRFRLHEEGSRRSKAIGSLVHLLRVAPPQSSFGAVLAVVGVTFLTAATAVVATNGFPSRLDETRVQFLDNGLSYAGDLCSSKRARCVFGDRESAEIVYVVGDSHALNLVYGLDRLFRERGIRGIAIYDHGCLFAYGTKRFEKGVADERCRRNVSDAYDYLAGTQEPVILAGDYAGYRNNIAMFEADSPLHQSEDEYFNWLGHRFTERASLAPKPGP